ncbi:helix-turn-helix transcriptional regulator [Spirochaetia bacterium]|nr:helix-turn-helix transcriptional regulator [Spirochaetia bacterium]
MSGQFIHSNVPIAGGNQIYLERPRIDNILERAFESRTIIVTAGAGYGKTHGVYSFLKKHNYLTMWMQLSERDNAASRFWENFIGVLRAISEETAERLAETGFPETERQFERYLTIPRNLVIQNAKYVFVYDDFHLIQDKKVLRFMEHSISMPFPNITSILISRNEPAVNTAALRSRHIAARITERDLKFTQEEMGEYFRIQNIRTSPETAAAVYRDCEGWAFAIHLSGLFLKNAPPGGGNAHGYVPVVMRSNIFRLIEIEIMCPLTPHLRKFLVKLSLIDHLSQDLLALIAGDKNLIDEMERIGSFIRFDTYRNAYQIHHLFLEYLEKQQDALSTEEKKEVYEKAALWCVENNQKMDAISYYEKAENFNEIIALFFTLPLIVPNLMAKFILELLNRTPQKFYEENPAIIIVHARILVSLGLFAEAAEELNSAIPRLEAVSPTPLVHRLLLGCYITLGFIGLINSINTADYGFAGLFEKAAAHAPLSGYVTRPPVSVLTISSYICRVGSSVKGEMEKYIEALTAIAPHAAVVMGGCMMGLEDLAKAELAFFRGNTAEAEKHAHTALLRAADGMQYEIENRAFFYLLRIYLSGGNHEEMRRILKEMEARLKQHYYLNRFVHHDVNMGWFRAQIGNTAQLAPWLKNDFEERDLNSRARGLEILVKAKYHFAEKRYPAALAALENWTDDAGSPVLGKVETKALESVCRYQMRRREGAFAALGQAYTLAEPNGFTMPFTELGKDMRTLAEAALKEKAPLLPEAWLKETRRNAAAYAKKLYAAAAQFSRNTAEPSGISIVKKNRSEKTSPALSNPLSRREKEVLSYLSRGLTRKEIAAALDLSINTIKSNVRSIYNKLGAVNRADAVRIAADTGILRETHAGS